MDATALLAAQAVAILAPALGRLVRKTSEGMLDQAATGMSKSAWAQATKLWASLRPEVRKNPRVSQAVKELAASPDDEDLRAVLRVELKKMLDGNELLRSEVAKVVRIKSTTTATSKGHGISVAAGHDVNKVHVGDIWEATSETAAQIKAFANAMPLLKFLMVVGVLVMLAGFATFMTFVFGGMMPNPRKKSPLRAPL